MTSLISLVENLLSVTGLKFDIQHQVNTSGESIEELLILGERVVAVITSWIDGDISFGLLDSDTLLPSSIHLQFYERESRSNNDIPEFIRIFLEIEGAADVQRS